MPPTHVGRAVLRLLLLLLACGLVAACAKPEAPRVTARAARVTATGPKGIDLTLELDVHNPNAFPLLVQSVEGTLEVAEGAELGRGVAQPKTSIPAKGSSAITSQLSIPWSNLAALAPFALSPEPVPYTFRGRAAVGGERLNVDVPFSLSGQLSREQLLSIGLGGLSIPGAPHP
ncbi:MAG TPA: LEA type 2 family protein [Polyangiaceae bacterium]|nr:LEA type 2 family protein [Polyangiaceae bacterium]